MQTPQTHPPGRGRSEAPARILEATEAILLESGVEALTIRRVSQGCGYSAPTIYHHFGDKKGLIDALLEARFSLLLVRMRALPATGDPVRDLHAMARAFIAFALENPDHYALLSAPRLGSEPEEAVPAAEASRELVKQALAALAEEGALATSNVDAAFQVLWALLHGLISLHLHPQVALEDGVVELALDMAEQGLLRPARYGTEDGAEDGAEGGAP